MANGGGERLNVTYVIYQQAIAKRTPTSGVLGLAVTPCPKQMYNSDAVVNTYRSNTHNANESLQCTIDIRRTVLMLRSQQSVIVQMEAQYNVLKTLDVSIQTFATVQKPFLRGDSNERISIRLTGSWNNLISLIN
ncbi:hypothetical protein T02_679 [Trichinella nativa]|uniref:Uncharacterized protein n=1 Tax=Trichinella nativa TaxID=6335 RepID=A0A0V1KQA0_9BILA|nr:hypothetical protein T02_679 [Trichinella nativa]